MANKEHLKVINEAIEKKDISIWNKWRKENPDVVPDLTDAIYKEADLSEVDLQNADFRNANLERATLWRANFS